MSPSAEIVNPVPVEEVPTWLAAMITTFLGDPRSPGAQQRNEALRRAWVPERAWGARHRDRWVATLRTEKRSLSLPGPDDTTRLRDVDAVTNVTVSATHRRQGLMSRMMDGSLRAARERGDALSILIAAEWPIYGRFGYAPATQAANYELRQSAPGATCAGDLTRVRQVERDEFGDVAPTVYEAARRRRAGQIDRNETWWNRTLGRDGYASVDGLPPNWFVHDGDDGPDGLLAWKPIDDWGLVRPFGGIEVWNLTSASDLAYRDLWAYLCAVDVIERVRIANRPIDEPVRWLLGDARSLVMTGHVDFTWLRLLDVPAALAARAYAVADEVVLEVVDEDLGGFAAGRYRLSTDGAGVQCERTNADAELVLSQRTLASIYLGGFRLRELIAAQPVEERRAGALSRVDLMFSTALAPWNGTWF